MSWMKSSLSDDFMLRLKSTQEHGNLQLRVVKSSSQTLGNPQPQSAQQDHNQLSQLSQPSRSFIVPTWICKSQEQKTLGLVLGDNLPFIYSSSNSAIA